MSNKNIILKITYTPQNKSIILHNEGKDLTISISEIFQILSLGYNGIFLNIVEKETIKTNIELPFFKNNISDFLCLLRNLQSLNKEEHKKLKRKTPKKMRSNLWQHYHGNNNKGICYVCGIEITSTDNWQMAHVIAHFNGGLAELTNLRTCCAKCNLAMGTQNLYAFIEQSEHDGPGKLNKDKYLLEHPEEIKDSKKKSFSEWEIGELRSSMIEMDILEENKVWEMSKKDIIKRLIIHEEKKKLEFYTEDISNWDFIINTFNISTRKKSKKQRKALELFDQLLTDPKPAFVPISTSTVDLFSTPISHPKFVSSPIPIYSPLLSYNPFLMSAYNPFVIAAYNLAYNPYFTSNYNPYTPTSALNLFKVSPQLKYTTFTLNTQNRDKIESLSENKVLKYNSSQAEVWNIESGKVEFRIDEINSSAVLSSCQIISSSYNKLNIWNTKTKEIEMSLETNISSSCLAVVSSYDEKLILSKSDTSLTVWNTQKQKSLTFKLTSPIKSLVTSETYIVDYEQKKFKIFNLRTGGCEFISPYLESYVINKIVEIPGNRLITYANEGNRFWNIKNGEDLTVTFSICNNFLISFSKKKVVDPTNGDLEIVFDKCFYNLYIMFMFTLSDNRIVTTSTDMKLRIWAKDSFNTMSVQSFHTFSSDIIDVILLRDAINGIEYERIITASSDKTIRIWNPLISLDCEITTTLTNEIESIQSCGNGQIKINHLHEITILILTV
jgi:hypothetical protein